MSGYVIWNKDKPMSTSDEKEARRLSTRIKIIDKVLKEMGYSGGYEKYNEYITEMSKDFKKYLEFLRRVNELSEKEGV